MKKTHRTIFTAFSIALAGSFLAYTASATAPLQKGDTLPDFSLPTLKGHSITDKDVSALSMGILYVFKEKCPPCFEGIKELDAAALTGNDGSMALLIGKGEKASIADTVSPLSPSMPVAYAEADLLNKLGAAHIFPTTIITGPDGKVISFIQGAQASESAILAAIGKTELQRANHGKALALFEKASQKDKDPLHKAGLGYSHLKMGNLMQAEASFKDLSDGKNARLAAEGKAGMARVMLEKGDIDSALALSRDALALDATSTAANLVHGEALYKKGNTTQAAEAFMKASAEDTQSNFAFHKTEARIAHGNLMRKDKKADIALVSYKKAAEEDPFSAEALSNQAVLLQEMGSPEKALPLLKTLKKRMPHDKMAATLMRQAERAIAQKADIEKQNHIRSLVKDLSARFKAQKTTDAETKDVWTRPKPAVWVLGFDDLRSPSASGRIGDDLVLAEEIAFTLEDNGVTLVDRALLDHILAELDLGSSALTDPTHQARLGKIVSARLLVNGRITDRGVSLSVIDMETTARVARDRIRDKKADPIDSAEAFAAKISRAIVDNYPIRATLKGQKVNLGTTHGIKKGMTFTVFEGSPEMMENVGAVRVTSVDAKTATATPVSSGKLSDKKTYLLSQIVK